MMLSHTIDILAVPSNAIVGLMALGLILMPFTRAGRWLLALGAVLLLLAGLSPLSNALMIPLEQRFPPLNDGAPPDGIIVLGGGITIGVSIARGEAALTEAAERLFAAAELARRFPQARIIYSGGDPRLHGNGPGEGVWAKPLLESLGIPGRRIELEDKSVDTYQNAAFSKVLAQPKPGERWYLVTSAYHMPRAVGAFRQVGFDVVPYPVDWRTPGRLGPLLSFRAASAGLARTDVVAHEWIGLLSYWLSGRSSELFPAPN